MSRPDNITLANKKNKVGKSQLKTELNRINRQQLIDIRMHNNAKQRFKSKYAKLDVFDENKGSEASDVVMYETHNPGFCYRRNGDCRLPQSNVTSSSVDAEDLHMLLFTNGEVDIDKLLCLYLLTAHRTESLTPPPKSQRPSFLAREQSPLERLVDRSKRRTFDNKLLKLLPLYILSAPYYMKETNKDPRLFSRIIINDQILQIVSSVKLALETSNPAIIGRFMEVVNKKEQIESVMAKPKMEDFYKSLHGQNIISSCESFHLEFAQKDDSIALDIDIEPLKELTRSIRQNILQMPNPNAWKLFYKTSEDSIHLETIKAQRSQEIEEGRFIYKNTQEDTISLEQLPTTTSSIMSDDMSKLDILIDYDISIELPPYKMNTVAAMQPKIMPNLQKGFSDLNYNKILTQTKLEKKEKLNFDILAKMLSQKVLKESLKDYNKMMTVQPSETLVPDSPALPEKAAKFTLKQTTCEACINKWRSPLPSPKTSKLKKVPLPVLKDTSYFSSRSAQRVSEMIDDEVKKFEVYGNDVKPETVQLSDRTFKKLATGSYPVGSSIEIVNLDDLELAKIRQEIKVNETQKKFAKFMQKFKEK